MKLMSNLPPLKGLNLYRHQSNAAHNHIQSTAMHISTSMNYPLADYNYHI